MTCPRLFSSAHPLSRVYKRPQITLCMGAGEGVTMSSPRSSSYLTPTGSSRALYSPTVSKVLVGICNILLESDYHNTSWRVAANTARFLCQPWRAHPLRG